MTSHPSDEEISALAYSLWEADGRLLGQDLKYWLIAKEQLLRQAQAQPAQPLSVQESTLPQTPQPPRKGGTKKPAAAAAKAAPAPAPKPAPTAGSAKSAAPKPAALKTTLPTLKTAAPAAKTAAAGTPAPAPKADKKKPSSNSSSRSIFA